MISVRNHLLQLNGNRLIPLFLVLIVLLGASCNAFKPITPGKPDYGQNDNNPDSGSNQPDLDPTDVTQPPGKVDTVTWEVEDPLKPPPNIALKDPTTGVVSIPMEKVTKSSYNMVVMLPFFINRVTPMGDTPEESQLALEFYEGVKLALDQLENEGVKLNINVLDTQADTNVVKILLSRSEVNNADIILGPITRDNNRIVARFARETGIVVVSPLNTRTDIVEQNPFYIQANPSSKTIFTQLLRYVNERHNGLQQVIVIAPEGRTGDLRVGYLEEANRLISRLPNPPELNTIRFKLEEGAVLDLTETLQTLDSNVVIIPSRDQGFVGFVMRELSLLREKHPTIVYGMSRWQEFERIDFNYFQNLSVHLPSSGFASPNNNMVVDFKRNYLNKVGILPTTYAYKGYDTCLYFGRMLRDYGVYFQGFFDEADALFMHSGFSFKPIYQNPGIPVEGEAVISQYENQLIDIIEFDDFKYRRVGRQKGN
ncbi:MAG: hypothetical protein AAF502_01830 [Bacteroidota bacterium]